MKSLKEALAAIADGHLHHFCFWEDASDAFRSCLIRLFGG